ncbi:MAG: nitroreductase family protein [Dehalococcoidia bacterium]|nr:nitroreductase family protein [Dehalococcoidia bacterium]MDZ4246152.1 nitroreductase family protein [Dehalococcoidia bacterium]
MEYENLLGLVQKRRSTRRFKPDPVPDELINKVIEVARWAPSGANSQPWEFIIITDKVVKDKITEIAREACKVVQEMEFTRSSDMQHPLAFEPVDELGFKDAPVLIIEVGDPRTREAAVLAAQRGPHIYVSSLANAFLYLHLAATSLGLGSQWLSSVGHPLFQERIKQELGIPDNFTIYDVFVLGYPAEKPKERIVRGLEEIVHREGYEPAKYRSDAEVMDFARRVQLGW